MCDWGVGDYHQIVACVFQIFCQMVPKVDHSEFVMDKKNGPTAKRQPRDHAVYVQTVGMLINILSHHADSLCVLECSHITSTHTHAHTNTAKFYPSHLKCRNRSPSRSTGAQSLTTDIILIAHRGRVVCPHSHPDSLCAENPTTENCGLRVSGGLRTAVSVRCVSPKSILLSSLRLPCLQNPATWEQLNTDPN